MTSHMWLYGGSITYGHTHMDTHTHGHTHTHCCSVPELGVVHILLELVDHIERLLSQLFGGLDDEGFGGGGHGLHLTHLGTACPGRRRAHYVGLCVCVCVRDNIKVIT